VSRGNIHTQASYNPATQEPSVERLKSCIADLKKLATSKVKKTVTNSSNQNLHTASNGVMPQ
jgi:hypothetical protein